MVKYWLVLVLVLSPIINARKSSSEDQKDMTIERRDLTLGRKDLTIDRRNPTIDRKDLTRDRKGLTHGRDITQSHRNLDYLKDSIEYKDPTKYRKGPKQYRRQPRELRRAHYHTKRHMLPESELSTTKKRSTTLKPTREIRKKPSGHLTPLEDDDMDNDEVVSVAIGPPPLRGKFEKNHKKHNLKPTPLIPPPPSAVELVKDLFTQLTKEFLSRDADENFVFGQYLGNAMKNLTSELRLSMQHEVLELIVKYQKANKKDPKIEEEKPPQMLHILKDVKVERKFIGVNDTEEPWPDFSNLAKIVG